MHCHFPLVTTVKALHVWHLFFPCTFLRLVQQLALQSCLSCAALLTELDIAMTPKGEPWPHRQEQRAERTGPDGFETRRRLWL